jgi:hypothetical protein
VSMPLLNAALSSREVPTGLGIMALATAIHHKIDGEADLVIGAVCTAAAGNHARADDAVNATVVQRVHALADSARPGDLVTHLGRPCNTG